MALAEIKDANGHIVYFDNSVCNCCGANHSPTPYSGVSICAIEKPSSEDKITKPVYIDYDKKSTTLIKTIRSIPIKGGYINLETWRYP